MSHRALLPFLLALFLTVLPGAAGSAMRTQEDFDSPQQAERYREVLGELRCLVCQNQSLASSDADLAKDLRDEVYRLMVEEGKSDEAIIRFMVDRYGEFVLYEPPMAPSTYLLWGGPAVLLLIGIGTLVAVVRRKTAAPEPELTPEERQRIARYLNNDPEGDSRD
jgi:cytochrome c-type biogenesis protein CcmH